jgi:hypothetical protein
MTETTQANEAADGQSQLTEVLGQHVGWMVFLNDGDASRAAMYPLADEAEAKDAAERWSASICGVYTAPGSPYIRMEPNTQ